MICPSTPLPGVVQAVTHMCVLGPHPVSPVIPLWTSIHPSVQWDAKTSRPPCPGFLEQPRRQGLQAGAMSTCAGSSQGPAVRLCCQSAFLQAHIPEPGNDSLPLL